MGEGPLALFFSCKGGDSTKKVGNLCYKLMKPFILKPLLSSKFKGFCLVMKMLFLKNKIIEINSQFSSYDTRRFNYLNLITESNKEMSSRVQFKEIP